MATYALTYRHSEGQGPLRIEADTFTGMEPQSTTYIFTKDKEIVAVVERWNVVSVMKIK